MAGIHERAEQRHPGGDQHEVGAHVGQQVDVEPADPAVGVGSDRDLLPLVAAVVHGHVAFAAALGPLDRPAQLAGDQDGQHLFCRDLQLGSEAAADVGRDDPEVLLRNASDQGEHHPQHVRDLGRRPERELPADARADHRARLHRGRDQPLLAVVPLKHHRRVAEGRVHITLREGPDEALVAGLVDLRRVVLQGGPDVEHRRERLVVDLDGGQGVGRGVAVAGHHAGDGLADVAHLVDRHRRVSGDDDVRRDRPGAGQAALLGGEVRTGVGRDDPGLAPRGADVDRGDPGVRVRAPQERHVQHAGQPDVVGPVGLAGDEPLVFLAQPCATELRGRRGGRLCFRGHALAPACAARRTARTMFS